MFLSFSCSAFCRPKSLPATESSNITNKFTHQVPQHVSLREPECGCSQARGCCTSVLQIPKASTKLRQLDPCKDIRVRIHCFTHQPDVCPLTCSNLLMHVHRNSTPPNRAPATTSPVILQGLARPAAEVHIDQIPSNTPHLGMGKQTMCQIL